MFCVTGKYLLHSTTIELNEQSKFNVKVYDVIRFTHNKVVCLYKLIKNN